MADEKESQTTEESTSTLPEVISAGNVHADVNISLSQSLGRLTLQEDGRSEQHQPHLLDSSCQSSCTSDSSVYSTCDSGNDESSRPRKREKRRGKRPKKKKRDQNGDAVKLQLEEEIIRYLTSMNLPYMPSPEEMRKQKEPPTIRILVVADIDLASASALAESALATSVKNSNDSESQTSPTNPLHKVDLCVACGPFCKEDDLRLYYQGKQRRKHTIRQYYSHGNPTQRKVNSSGATGRYEAPTKVYLDSSIGGLSYNHRSRGSFPTPLPPPAQPTFHDHTHSHGQPQMNCLNSYGLRHLRHQEGSHPPPSVPRRLSPPHNQNVSSIDQAYYPYRRSREETAALEGLVTAAISQLESIVCRVVVVPGGTTDPITISMGRYRNVVDVYCDDGDDDDDDDDDDTQDDNDSWERRLTPNSRNIHQRWMPLGPGLGIAGLAYLEWQKLQQEPPKQIEEDDDDDSDIDDELEDIIDEDAIEIDEDEEYSDSQDDDNFAEMPPLINGISHLVSPGAESSSSRSISATSETTRLEMQRLKREYDNEYCKQLQKLVQIAPPVSAISDTPPFERTDPLIDDLLQTPLFQSILVSQFHHWQPPTENGGRNHNGIKAPVLDDSEYHNDVEEESFDPPWPDEHETFCALPLIQDHVVLEIAAGLNSKGLTAQPKEIPKGKMKVVLPGSLRERGEFCLVDVAFMKDATPPKSASPPRSTSSELSSSLPKKPPAGSYRWMVRQTRFHCLNEFV